MIIAIVLMGIAMVMFSTALIPQIKDASTSHYQSRAIALGHSMMSQILARNFDHYYDDNGGMLRCGESGADACSPLGRDGETSPLLLMTLMIMLVVGTPKILRIVVRQVAKNTNSQML